MSEFHPFEPFAFNGEIDRSPTPTPEPGEALEAEGGVEFSPATKATGVRRSRAIALEGC